jgi:hypothetical protein
MNTKKDFQLPFNKQNYILMIVGVVIIALGYILMSGGGTDDPNVFSYELYSTRRIVVAPLLLVLGFAIEVVAIMKK